MTHRTRRGSAPCSRRSRSWCWRWRQPRSRPRSPAHSPTTSTSSSSTRRTTASTTCMAMGRRQRPARRSAGPTPTPRTRPRSPRTARRIPCLLQIDVNLARSTQPAGPLGAADCSTDDGARSRTGTTTYTSTSATRRTTSTSSSRPTATTCPRPSDNLFGFPNGIAQRRPAGLPGGCTRDLVHRFYQEQYQLDGGARTAT